MIFAAGVAGGLQALTQIVKQGFSTTYTAPPLYKQGELIFTMMQDALEDVSEQDRREMKKFYHEYDDDMIFLGMRGIHVL